MGIVYKAKDTVLDRIVAYKVLPDALKENPQALKNFLREAKSAAQLNHPNIVTVYDAGEQDGRYYIAMEFVDGNTLKEIVRRRGAIASGGVLHVLVQMCEALAFAHDKKIVHRDIKTANTMWTRDRKAKIMDFGLAKIVEEVRNHTTLVSGTPYYMSPEQTLGPQRRLPHRHLLARRHDLRAGDRPAALHRGQHPVPPRPHAAARRARAQGRRPAAAGGDRRALPAQGSRAALPVGARDPRRGAGRDGPIAHPERLTDPAPSASRLRSVTISSRA